MRKLILFTVAALAGCDIYEDLPPSEPAAGPQGPAGDDGDDGNDGDDGRDGRDGAAGTPGSAGPAGANGQNGSAGPQGSAGANGANGSDGAPGAQGPQGPAGDGNDGEDGQDGADGADGANCYDNLGDQNSDGIVNSWDCLWAATCGVPADQVGDQDGDGNVDIDDCRALLQGEDGADGAQGPQGPQGPAGRDGQNNGAPGCNWECPIPGALICAANGIPQECRTDGDQDVCGEWVSRPACPQGQSCNNGQCVAPGQQAEVCNGSDDDGDGLVDEGLPDIDGDRLCDTNDPDADGDGVVNAQDACWLQFGDAILNGCPCSAQLLCPAGRVCNARGTCDPAPPPACNPACPQGQNCVNGQCIAPPVCNPACAAGQVCIANNQCSAHFDGITIEWQMPAGTRTTQISLPGFWGNEVSRGANDGRDGRLLCSPQVQAPPADGECWRDLETAADAGGNVTAITANIPVPRGYTLEFNVNFEIVAPFWAASGSPCSYAGTFPRTSSPENAVLIRTPADNREGGCSLRVTRP
ncbi:MAG: hypothetical protein Q7S89_01735 [bacterium]|nr:hypothetical protein [bacterium]